MKGNKDRRKGGCVPGKGWFDEDEGNMIYYDQMIFGNQIFGAKNSLRKAFSTPWEVCFNIAYPPPCMRRCNG